METAQVIQSYRISNSFKDIIDVLNKGQELNSAFMWQTLPDHRTIFKFQEFTLNLQEKKIIITYSGDQEFINPSYSIYIQLPFREMVFKGRVLNLQKNKVTINIPQEIHLRELREAIRSEFQVGETFAHLRLTAAHVGTSRFNVMKVVLKDISQVGLGLFISENNSQFFKQGTLIELMGLEEVNFITPFLGKVVYSRREPPSFKQKKTLFRVGVKMLKPIPENLIIQLNEKKKRQRTLSKELLELDAFSEDFQEMMSKEVAKELQKMKKRPSILKFLNKLELIRGEDSYLEEHIKVLTFVCTLMARSMSWVSDASMEKFVYASYIHDAPFFSHPRLARIRNMDEFELLKDQLSAEEQQIFLTSPHLAEKIALADQGAPPDVSQMLALQKELPDGQGFPRKWNCTKISPMASLFILAHALTDEIMVNPDWDIELWIKDAKKNYRGGHFNKIVEAMDNIKTTLKRTRTLEV